MKAEKFIAELYKSMGKTGKKDCPMCNGKGAYRTIHQGDYGEEHVIVTCACTRESKSATKDTL